MDKEDITPIFNRLSWLDRSKLTMTAGMKALTDFISEDGQKYPWKNPFYAAYMALLIVPIPVVPQAAILLTGTLGWARFSKSEMAAEIRGRLAEAFTPASIMKEYGTYIEPVPGKPDSYQLRDFDLVMKTTRETWKTACQVCYGAGPGFRDWFWPSHKPPS